MPLAAESERTTITHADRAAAAHKALTERDRDRDRVHLLESTVVHWGKVIKGLLAQDCIPNHILAEVGDRPGPLVELSMRAASAFQLATIVSQFRDRKARSVLEGLEAVNSSYTEAFRSMERDLSAGCDEATETLRGAVRAAMDDRGVAGLYRGYASKLTTTVASGLALLLYGELKGLMVR